MSVSATLKIRQDTPVDGKYPIRLTLEREKQPALEGDATIEFALSEQEREELRRYLEEYLQRADSVAEQVVDQVVAGIRSRGEELYTKVLAANGSTQTIWFAIREQLADLRIEITTGIAEAASIPWELIRDPESDSAIALRVKSFVRVQSNPNMSFVPVPESDDGRVPLLYVVCRPSGVDDVSLRAVANRLLQDLGEDLIRFDITALRPPTFEQLQIELQDAKAAGRPYHIVHFDGHGVYADLSQTTLADWLKALSVLTLGGEHSGKHGYLLFEHPSDDKMRPVPGDELGKLLHDCGVPVLVLNACQSAMHEATEKPQALESVHDEVRAIGSLSQAVIDQGIPAVLGMRYSVFVVTAAQYIGQLYVSLANGHGFGEAATEGRKHLQRNPDRWVGLQPRPLQDWFVPVVYEAQRLELLPVEQASSLLVGDRQDAYPTRDPVQIYETLRRYVPDHGFVGRDETLLLLDRAFDDHAIVLLHAYAGQGKTTTAVEFARWYAQTGGLMSDISPHPIVLFTSFESHTDLTDVLNQVGQMFDPLLKANEIEWNAINDRAERRQLVLQLLRQIPVLWIWDNVEPVAGFPAGTESAWTAAEQGELADFLKQLKLDGATKVRILLTSRRDEQGWLGGVPYRVKMPRMSRADAAALAVQLGKEKKITRQQVTQWEPLLDYCQGNPMTLRVLAGQAIKENRTSPQQIEAFVAAIRSGETNIEDEDQSQGRDKSLGASLDYGFRHAFSDQELPIIALLHLFQGTVDVTVLQVMGSVGEHALPELEGKNKEQLSSLLDRAREAGLLTHLGATWYTIHPALPWFLRQMFARCFPSVVDRSAIKTETPGSRSDPRPSDATAALRAWVEAVGELSNYYHRQFNEGNRDVIQFLSLEEANLLHARREARRHGWWSRVPSAMQGLSVLYEYQGRTAEWSRLVAEIVPDYCTDDDEPVSGREDRYGLVMEYRVGLAQDHDRDLTDAARLQEKCVAWNRQQAADALAQPPEAPLDDIQRNRIRTLATSFGTLGQILSEQGSGDCVPAYEESIEYSQRIGDTAAESIAHYNLGHAYKGLPDIRDLDAAEAAYQRSLDLHADDALGRSRCILQIGMVHHERFRDARAASGSEVTLLAHAQATESHYQQALALCPATAVTYLGPIHNGLGNLSYDVGQTEQARDHYEQDVQIREQTGDIYGAGQTRCNLALMYLQSASREESPQRRRDLLRRAAAYSQAALRDFHNYQGRAAEDEAKTQQIIDDINEQLAAPAE